MKSLVRLFVTLIKFCLVLTASIQQDVPNSRVAGGHEAKIHNFPFMASLQIRVLWVRVHLCGGSLINENWVLTAGHCIKHSWILNWLSMDAVAGAHDIDSSEPTTQIIPVVKRIPHPDYIGDIGPHDIGLVKSKYPFQFTKEIQPISLPYQFKMDHEYLTLVGWGEYKSIFGFIPLFPGKLQEVQLTFLPHEECHVALNNLLDDGETNPLVENSNICTGPITGGIAACGGDSGGPLIQYRSKDINQINKDEQENIINDGTTETITDETDSEAEIESIVPVIIGVVSWGVVPCGEKGAPTVYTNVTENMDFILDTIENN